MIIHHLYYARHAQRYQSYHVKRTEISRIIREVTHEPAGNKLITTA